jgi:hypothetical protein
LAWSALSRHIGDELADAVFDLFAVGRALDVGFDLLPHGGQCLVGVAKQQQTLAVLLRELSVHVNADEDAEQRDFFQMGPERKVTRSSQIAYQRVEPLDVGVVRENACKLPQQSILAFVGEEARGHLG